MEVPPDPHVDIIDYFHRSFFPTHLPFSPLPDNCSPDGIDFRVYPSRTLICVRVANNKFWFRSEPYTENDGSGTVLTPVNVFGNLFRCTRGVFKITTELPSEVILKQLFQIFPTTPVGSLTVFLPTSGYSLFPECSLSVEKQVVVVDRLCNYMVNDIRQKSCDEFTFRSETDPLVHNISPFADFLSSLQIRESFVLDTEVTHVPWSVITLPPKLITYETTEAADAVFLDQISKDCVDIRLDEVSWRPETYRTFVFGWFTGNIITPIRKMKVTTRRYTTKPSEVFRGVKPLCRKLQRNMWRLRRPDGVIAQIKMGRRFFSFNIV